MNTSRKIIITVILFLGLHYIGYSQYSEYGGKPSTSTPCIDASCEIVNFEIKYDNSSQNLISMDRAMENARQSYLDSWLNRQEGVLTGEINKLLGTSHGTYYNAITDLWRNFENVKSSTLSYTKVKNQYANTKSISAKGQKLEAYDLKWILLRENEINSGKINTSLLGNITIDGVQLSNIKTTTSLNLLKNPKMNSFSSLTTEYGNATSLYDGVVKSFDDGSLQANIVDMHLANYRSKGDNLESKIRSASYYLYHVYNQKRGVIYYTSIIDFPVPSYLTEATIIKNATRARSTIPFEIAVFDDVFAGNYINGAGNLPAAYRAAEVKEAKADYLNEYLNGISEAEALENIAFAGVAATNAAYIKDRPNLKKEVLEYIDKGSYSSETKDVINNLFNSITGSAAPQLPVHGYYGAEFQSSSNLYRALSVSLTGDSGHLGFNNEFPSILNELFFANAEPEVKGRLIRTIFEAPGLGISVPVGLTNEVIGSTFDFKNTNLFQFDIVYQSGYGSELTYMPLNDHLETLAKADYLARELGLSIDEERWLGTKFDASLAMYDYVLNGGSKGFAREAVLSLREGGEVDFEEELIFDSSFVQSRAYCVYNFIKSVNGNLFRKTIRNFIDNKEYRLKFVVEPISRYAAIGYTDGNDIDKGLITIYLDEHHVSTARPLTLAGDILHEGIHAEIFRFVHSQDPTVDPKDRARVHQLLERYKPYSEGVGLPHHVYMKEDYINPMAEALRQIDGNRFPADHYLHLAWEGIADVIPISIQPTNEKMDLWASKIKEVYKINTLPCP